jgi:hypothetical protein
LRSVEAAGEARWDTRVAPGGDRRQALIAVVERIGDNDGLFLLDLEETVFDQLRDPRIYGGDRVHPFEHVEAARLHTVDRDARLRPNGLRINKEPRRGEGRVDVAQSVHDALEGYASQRPAAERYVESLTRDVQCFCAVDAETDAASLLGGQRGISRDDVLAARVERIDGRAMGRCECRQASIAAADIDDAFASKGDEVTDSGRFNASLVTPMHA